MTTPSFDKSSSAKASKMAKPSFKKSASTLPVKLAVSRHNNVREQAATESIGTLRKTQMHTTKPAINAQEGAAAKSSGTKQMEQKRIVEAKVSNAHVMDTMSRGT
jgi:hypothetical protein